MGSLRQLIKERCALLYKIDLAREAKALRLEKLKKAGRLTGINSQPYTEKYTKR